ncbi:MAG: hypothetical protein ACREJ3_14005 [Polyangiaceae bacterium]
MNERGKMVARSLIALGGVVGITLASGCGGSSTPPANTAANGATIGAPGQAPPGYPGSPPGYPQQAGYAQQPGYPQQAPAGYPQQQPSPGYAQPGQPQPAPGGQQPPAPLAPTDPNSLQGILQGIQGALGGTMVAPGALAGDVTEVGLKAQAMRYAPGMQPEGQELKQSLTQGQHAVMMVTLQAGKCYAVLGFSPPGGVQDIDLNLLAPPFYMTLAGQDLTHNNTPAIGGAPNPMCPVVMFPLQYKLDIFARSGSGPIAVQLYSKNK